jgi:hypothetical protein
MILLGPSSSAPKSLQRHLSLELRRALLLVGTLGVTIAAAAQAALPSAPLPTAVLELVAAPTVSAPTQPAFFAVSSSAAPCCTADVPSASESAARPATAQAVVSSQALPPPPIRPFSRVGIGAHVGLNGIGFDVATPLTPLWNLRTGADFFSFTDSFSDQGANVNASLQLRTGHAALDWFPFGGRIRISPLVYFGNNNNVRATALIPGGSTVTLNGADYISSPTDPLHGSGSVDFRKVSPGLSVGVGNLIPRSGGHFSFPVELGFYYVGQPTLKVAFTGSSCDPTQPLSTGCQSVTTDQEFQNSLAAFKARNNNNLSYASFFPIVSAGVGYSF